jgi:hypothetical protein
MAAALHLAVVTTPYYRAVVTTGIQTGLKRPVAGPKPVSGAVLELSDLKSSTAVDCASEFDLRPLQQ